jgi:hypothetical protein
MSRPVRRFPHDGYLSSRRLDERCYATCQRNLVMLEVDVFTASEKRLRDLVVSFSGLR